jgi:hypothetical protein
MTGAIKKAEEIVASTPGTYMLQQFDNPGERQPCIQYNVCNPGPSQQCAVPPTNKGKQAHRTAGRSSFAYRRHSSWLSASSLL